MIKFENPTNGRFYYLDVQRDIFNDLVLTVIRGGRYTRVVKHFGYNDPLAIQRQVDKISRQRLKRGYHLVV